ncbi:uncharacterized protein LOC115890753 [Sitophilus oryzae]|uniref:Uncharacterized protein LOC115890753 n=1 Tax=Sitophilus oryzae TaxID=7048 RepID=A0A6J2YUS5_SITOR|nr:uncharacterized protein LOC115890753 [Sitophilus oryzae]
MSRLYGRILRNLIEEEYSSYEEEEHNGFRGGRSCTDNIFALEQIIEKKSAMNQEVHVYRKNTHTDRYLHNNSNHHPGQKRGVIKTLVDRARRICEPLHITEELQYLDRALQANGYREQTIRRAVRPRKPVERQEGENTPPSGMAFLPYIRGVTDRIGKLLRKRNIKPILQPTRKIQEHLRSAKDPRDPLSSAGVYRIPCSCGSVYVGTTKRSINTRLTEHKRSCRLGQTEKSALAEHTITQVDHQISSSIIRKSFQQGITTLQDYIVKRLKSTNIKTIFNRKEEGLHVNKIWYKLLDNTEINVSSTKYGKLPG